MGTGKPLTGKAQSVENQFKNAKERGKSLPGAKSYRSPRKRGNILRNHLFGSKDNIIENPVTNRMGQPNEGHLELKVGEDKRKPPKNQKEKLGGTPKKTKKNVTVILGNDEKPIKGVPCAVRNQDWEWGRGIQLTEEKKGARCGQLDEFVSSRGNRARKTNIGAPRKGGKARRRVHRWVKLDYLMENESRRQSPFPYGVKKKESSEPNSHEKEGMGGIL